MAKYVKPFLDLTGKKFGMLYVIAYVGKDKYRHTKFDCICDCGKRVTVLGQSLRSGHTTSCGCKVQYANNQERKTRLFRIWANMRDRCLNKNNKAYANYGGRGIHICQEWENSFYSFQNWAINNGYNSALTIDRIDNNGNYTPDNCRWATRLIQNNNSSNNRWIEYNGQRMTLTKWAEKLNMSVSGLHKRLKKWPIEKALSMEEEHG